MDAKRKEAGQVEISFTYKRHIGPKYVYGSVKLQFDSLRPYSINSFARWPETDTYEKYAQEGVERALTELTGSLENTKVTLLRIDFDEASSAPFGFQSAAYVATYAADLV
jgi:hypothetical protein